MSSLSHADSAIPAEGAVCRPNISAAGKRRRSRVGYVAVTLSLVLVSALVACRAPWYLRALVGLPMALAAVAFLQVRRNTCVARAAEGTFEHDDFSKTPAPPEEVTASRRVAAGIGRDAALIGLAGAVLGGASILL